MIAPLILRFTSYAANALRARGAIALPGGCCAEEVRAMSATTAVPTLIDVNVTETYREVETWLDSIDGGNVDGGELATRQLAVVEPDLELLGRLARLQDDLRTDIRFPAGIAGPCQADRRNRLRRSSQRGGPCSPRR